METYSFAGKFLSRLERVDPTQVETFLTGLLKEKNFLEVVFDSLVEGVVVCSAAGKVLFLNEAARGLLGLRKKEVGGLAVREVFRARALQNLADEFAERPVAIRHREVRVRTPGDRIYDLTVVPIEDATGVMTHYVWIVSDQTETHRRLGERQQAESIKSLATLTAGIAHEVKNPLNSLNIHAQLIEKAARALAGRGEKSPELARLEHSTGVVLEEIQRLARIVDQFLAAVRPVRTNLRLSELNEILTAVADLVEPECAERGIELTLDLDSVLPRVPLDPPQFQQAVLNVVRNAIESIDRPDGRVRICSRIKDDHALVEVEDNGAGISEEDKVKMFEPYHSTKFGGTGLGLTVVYRVVQAHGGAIGVTSRPGDGTLFSIALPLGEKPLRLLEASAG